MPPFPSPCASSQRQTRPSAALTGLPPCQHGERCAANTRSSTVHTQIIPAFLGVDMVHRKAAYPFDTDIPDDERIHISKYTRLSKPLPSPSHLELATGGLRANTRSSTGHTILQLVGVAAYLGVARVGQMKREVLTHVTSQFSIY